MTPFRLVASSLAPFRSPVAPPRELFRLLARVEREAAVAPSSEPASPPGCLDEPNPPVILAPPPFAAIRRRLRLTGRLVEAREDVRGPRVRLAPE
jgi:hypothetical protein